MLKFLEKVEFLNDYLPFSKIQWINADKFGCNNLWCRISDPGKWCLLLRYFILKAYQNIYKDGKNGSDIKAHFTGITIILNRCIVHKFKYILHTFL